MGWAAKRPPGPPARGLGEQTAAKLPRLQTAQGGASGAATSTQARRRRSSSSGGGGGSTSTSSIRSSTTVAAVPAGGARLTMLAGSISLRHRSSRPRSFAAGPSELAGHVAPSLAHPSPSLSIPSLAAPQCYALLCIRPRHSATCASRLPRRAHCGSSLLLSATQPRGCVPPHWRRTHAVEHALCC